MNLKEFNFNEILVPGLSIFVDNKMVANMQFYIVYK